MFDIGKSHVIGVGQFVIITGCPSGRGLYFVGNKAGDSGVPTGQHGSYSIGPPAGRIFHKVVNIR